jgi:hypothetical protein
MKLPCPICDHDLTIRHDGVKYCTYPDCPVDDVDESPAEITVPEDND